MEVDEALRNNYQDNLTHWLISTQVARLSLRLSLVLVRRDRDRDGLLVFFVDAVLFRVVAAVYFLADLLVAAAPPVG